MDGPFFAQDEVGDESREEARQLLVDEWQELVAPYARGVKSGVARWVAGRPVRVPIGGVAGRRMLVLTPGPVLRKTWRSVMGGHRNVYMAMSHAAVDRMLPADSCAQRAKRPYAGLGTRRTSPPLVRDESCRQRGPRRRCASWAWGRSLTVALPERSTVGLYS